METQNWKVILEKSQTLECICGPLGVLRLHPTHTPNLRTLVYSARSWTQTVPKHRARSLCFWWWSGSVGGSLGFLPLSSLLACPCIWESPFSGRGMEKPCLLALLRPYRRLWLFAVTWLPCSPQTLEHENLLRRESGKSIARVARGGSEDFKYIRSYT